MEKQVKEDLIELLKKAVEILDTQRPSIYKLKELSSHTIHNSSIFQDEQSISIGVIIYSLSKILERTNYRVNLPSIKKCLKNAVHCLEDNEVDRCTDFIRELSSILSSIDGKYKFYVQEIMHQASVRRGSNIYRHGISASKTAELLGISLWELYNYLGATNIYDLDTDISSVRQRLKFTRGLFQ